MGIIAKLNSSRKPQHVRGSGGFAAAQTSRLTAALASEVEFINQVLRYQLRRLRARSRQARQNNPFAKRFAQLAVDNIAGPRPFKMQSKIKYASGKYDTAANAKMEAAYTSWGRAGNCEVTGRWSWNTMQRLLTDMLCVDGELLFKKLRGPQYGKHAFQLQIIDVDRLDEQKNETLANGGAIHMGVELTPYGKPVAYHLLKRKPSQWERGYIREYDRVLAEDIVHLFVPSFAEQNRGIPWCYAALLNLVHIGAFEEAAVVAARVGAAQMGFLQTPDSGEAMDATLPKDGAGNPQIEAEPGMFPVLPPGYEMSAWSPRYPDAAIEPFLKAMLRGTAAGLGVAYHNLANDPSDVNYSTAKVFGGEEHEMWKGLQDFVVDHLHQPLLPDWLRMQIIAGVLPFPLDRMDKYLAVEFRARRWPSPDPLKDAKANTELINAKLRSRTGVIADAGEDIEDVWDELAHEETMAKDRNLKLDTPAPGAAPAASNDTMEGADNDDDDTPDSGNAQT